MMKGELTKRTIVVTIFFWILVSSTASGSHLDSSSPTSGPPAIHQHKQVQKQVSHTRKNLSSFPRAKTKQIAPSPQKPRSIPTVRGKKTHMAKPHTTLGWKFLLHGQTHAAMAAYRQALRNNPQSAKAYLGLGITLKSLGKIEIAKKALLKAVKLNPRSPSALVHLGYLYARRQSGQADLSKARRLFQQASQLGDPFASIALLDMKSRPPL
jgi:tetratricopeptide (TPR) repeat protein